MEVFIGYETLFSTGMAPTFTNFDQIALIPSCRKSLSKSVESDC